MARSVGEALSTGLESGLRLAMDYNAQRTQQARQAELDRQHLDDRAFNRTRIERADARQQGLDTIQAADLQDKAAASTIQAAEQGGVPIPQTQQLAMADATRRSQTARAQGWAALGGPEFNAKAKQLGDAVQKAGKGELDLSTLSGPEFGAVVYEGTGHPLKQFMRGQDGSPSPIEQAGQQVIQGLEQGDQAAAIQGLNVLRKPSIDRIVGKPSPHGGTIVGARIEALHPDPNSPANDPHFIPMLKVWVRGDQKTSGDVARADRVQADGGPPGATGYYFAPITEDRGTGPNSKVKSFGMKDGLDFIGQNMHLAEVLNSPEGAAKVQEAYATPGMTPEDWAMTKAQLGIRPPETKTQAHPIAAGGSLAVTTTDKTGKTRTEIIQGNPKPAGGTGPNSTAAIEFKLNEIDAAEQEAKDAGTLTKARQASFDAERRAVRSGIKPGKYTVEPVAGGAAGPSLKDREQARKERKDDLTSLDKDVDAADRRVDNTRAALSAHLREKPDAFATPEASAAWTADRERLKAKQDKAEAAHQEAIDAKKAGQAEYQRAKAAEEAARSPTMGDAKSGKAAAPAAKPPAVGTVKGGYRFKGGNPASQASWEKV